MSFGTITINNDKPISIFKQQNSDTPRYGIMEDEDCWVMLTEEQAKRIMNYFIQEFTGANNGK